MPTVKQMLRDFTAFHCVHTFQCTGNHQNTSVLIILSSDPNSHPSLSTAELKLSDVTQLSERNDRYHEKPKNM